MQETVFCSTVKLSVFSIASIGKQKYITHRTKQAAPVGFLRQSRCLFLRLTVDSHKNQAHSSVQSKPQNQNHIPLKWAEFVIIILM